MSYQNRVEVEDMVIGGLVGHMGRLVHDNMEGEDNIEIMLWFLSLVVT